MTDEDDLDSVEGWLLIYAVLQFAVSLAVLLLLLAFWPPRSVWQFTAIGGIAFGFASAIGIFRRSSWAITVIGIDFAIGLVFFAASVYQQGLGSLTTLLREFAQFAIFLAWLEYFRSSKRVRNVLGRNLLRPAHTTTD